MEEKRPGEEEKNKNKKQGQKRKRPSQKATDGRHIAAHLSKFPQSVYLANFKLRLLRLRKLSSPLIVDTDEDLPVYLFVNLHASLTRSCLTLEVKQKKNKK